MDFQLARERGKIINSVRGFFIDREYLEVDTPVLSAALIPEAPIEVFETILRSDRLGSRSFYMVPSPEVHMKKLLAAGSGNIFQIGKSFRNLEQTGRQHNPEFTMLEWYTVEADYMQSAELTEELFGVLAKQAGRPELSPPFRRLSVQEAFMEFSGIDLEKAQSPRQLVEECERLGMLQVPTDSRMNWEDLYHRIFLTWVEPRLPADIPLLLYDYPRRIPCLARDIPGTPWKERWELYIDGIEIANCYSEETDPARVEDFFIRENAKKIASSAVVPDMDQEFLNIFHQGYPRSSGVALGIDRLVMALTGVKSIEGVIFFPISDIVGG